MSSYNTAREHHLFDSQGRPWIMFPSEEQIRRFPEIIGRADQSCYAPLLKPRPARVGLGSYLQSVMLAAYRILPFLAWRRERRQ